MNYDICPISGESKLEELFNYLTHGIAWILSFIGLPVLILFGYLYGDVWKVAGYALFGASLILLYGVSTYYHRCQSLQTKKNLRVMDHICIYILIAGSYSPFTLGPLIDYAGWTLFGIEWGIVLVGSALKIFAFDKTKTISLIGYLVMGWLIVLWWPVLSQTVSSTALTLVIIGGLSYSFGVIFFLWESLPYNHAIWHLFVINGSICHFFAVLML
jgi:hemolysin III